MQEFVLKAIANSLDTLTENKLNCRLQILPSKC